MASLDQPKLRPLSGRRVDHQGQAYVALEDSLGLFSGQVLIPLETFHHVIRHFDGRTSLVEIKSRLERETGRPTALADLKGLVEKLDRAMVLEGPTHLALVDQYARQGIRPTSHAGRSYPADDSVLRQDLARFFEDPRGAGLPSEPAPGPAGPLRAILSPHIDFGRGGPVYSHAYRRLVEQSDADIFVILGVAHQYCRNRFALTRKDFQTPLGTARTNRAFVDHLAEAAGAHLFEDELAHRTEHSIEFQVVFLQYVLGEQREFSIVPILVGSFHDLMQSGSDPIADPEVDRMVRALRSAEAASGKKVAYIGGIDLCHVGPEFGDPLPVDDGTLDTVKNFDQAMLDRASARDASGWFSKAAEVNNRWRVCGLAATYTLLEAIGPARGRLLSYDQAVNPSRTCCVTFASVAFEAEPAITDD
jgi:AmmeMemoRadiSam system protein B